MFEHICCYCSSLPHGLSPNIPFNNNHALLINNNNKHNNKHSRCQRYTLVTSHKPNSNASKLQLSDFDPHPKLYFERINDQIQINQNNQEAVESNQEIKEHKKEIQQNIKRYKVSN